MYGHVHAAANWRASCAPAYGLSSAPSPHHGGPNSGALLRAKAKSKVSTLAGFGFCGRDAAKRAPCKAPSIAGFAGNARRVAAMDRRDREAVHGGTV